MRIDPAISLAISLSLAALFTAAAARKVSVLGEFAGVIRNYHLVPDGLARTTAVMVIAAEIAIAAGLTAPSSRAPAAIAAAVLLLAYGTAIGINLMRGRSLIDCGCSFGGRGGDRLSSWLLVRNAVLALAAMTCAFPILTRPLGWLDALSIVLFISTAATLYLAAERLRSTSTRFAEHVG